MSTSSLFFGTLIVFLTAWNLAEGSISSLYPHHGPPQHGHYKKLCSYLGGPCADICWIHGTKPCHHKPQPPIHPPIKPPHPPPPSRHPGAVIWNENTNDNKNSNAGSASLYSSIYDQLFGSQYAHQNQFQSGSCGGGGCKP